MVHHLSLENAGYRLDYRASARVSTRRPDQISLRCLAIFLNGSLSVFALRRTAKVVRFRTSAIVSTLFALRTSDRSFLSCSGVQGARRGVPFISPSPSAQDQQRVATIFSGYSVPSTEGPAFWVVGSFELPQLSAHSPPFTQCATNE